MEIWRCMRVGKSGERMCCMNIVSDNKDIEYKYVILPDNSAMITSGEDYESAIPDSVSGALRIPTVLDGYRVAVIGKSAFEGCNYLTSVVIPEGVTTIGESAFYGCSGLTSVEIPPSVTSIGNEAFCLCEHLISVVIPEGVTAIGEDAFFQCENLTSVTIPESMTSIGSRAFAWCECLTSVIIPENVTSIGSRAFSMCNGVFIATGNQHYSSDSLGFLFDKSGHLLLQAPKNISKYVIPMSVTSIGEGAFFGCSKLVSMTIPEGVTSIGEGAFEACNNLALLEIPDSVEELGDDILGEGTCEVVENGVRTLVRIEEDDGDDEEEPDDDDDDDESDDDDEDDEDLLTLDYKGVTFTYRLVEDDDEPYAVIIGPKNTEEPPVKAFFLSESGYETYLPAIDADYDGAVEVPSMIDALPVRCIGEAAFAQCRFESIALPETIEIIDEAAFRRTELPQDFVLPSHCEQLGDYAFVETGLTELVLPDTIDELGDFILDYGTKLVKKEKTLKLITEEVYTEEVRDAGWREYGPEDDFDKEYSDEESDERMC